MLFIVDLIVLMCLVALFIQDFKERSVSVWLLVLFGFITFIRAYLLNEEFGLLVKWVAINSLILLIEMLLLKAYFSFRQQQFVNVVDRYIGLGDIVFMFIVTVSFSTYNFVAFMLLSLMASVLISLILLSRSSLKAHNIPLVSFLSFFYAVQVVITDYFKINMYSDAYLISLIG